MPKQWLVSIEFSVGFDCEYWSQVTPIQVNILRFLYLKQTTNGRQNVDVTGRRLVYLVGFDVFRPAEYSGNTNSSLPVCTFRSSQMSDSIFTVASIVGHVDDQGVFFRSHLFQLL